MDKDKLIRISEYIKTLQSIETLECLNSSFLKGDNNSRSRDKQRIYDKINKIIDAELDIQFKDDISKLCDKMERMIDYLSHPNLNSK